MSRLIRPGLPTTRRSLLAGGLSLAGLAAGTPRSWASGSALPHVFFARSGLPGGLPRRLLVLDDPLRDPEQPSLSAPDGTPVPLLPIGSDPLFEETTGLRLQAYVFSPPGPVPGNARLEIPGLAPIEVPLDPEQTFAITRALLRALHLQRCGVPLADAQTALRRRPCHLVDRTAEDPHDPEHILNVSGGWHDGPGYGKSVIEAARTIGTLLEAGGRNAEIVGDGALGIPESGNGQSDLDDELRFGARWLLAMESAEGAFFGGIAVEGAGSAVQADEDGAMRTVRTRSPEATAAAACALASLSRHFVEKASEPDEIDPEIEAFLEDLPVTESFADRCRSAAERAISALARSRANLPASGYAELIAAWHAIGRPAISGADTAFWEGAVHGLSGTPEGWPLGAALSLAESVRGSTGSLGAVGEVAQVRILEAAESSLGTDPHLRASAHGDVFTLERIVQAAVLQLTAYRLTRSPDFLIAAAAHAEIPLGLNRFGRVLVTGFEGERPLGIFEAQSLSQGLDLPGLAFATLGREGQDWYTATGAPVHEISSRSVRARPMRLLANAALGALLLALDREAAELSGFAHG